MLGGDSDGRERLVAPEVDHEEPVGEAPGEPGVRDGVVFADRGRQVAKRVVPVRHRSRFGPAAEGFDSENVRARGSRAQPSKSFSPASIRTSSQLVGGGNGHSYRSE